MCSQLKFKNILQTGNCEVTATLTVVSRGNLWFTKWVDKTGLKASEPIISLTGKTSKYFFDNTSVCACVCVCVCVHDYLVLVIYNCCSYCRDVPVEYPTV